MGMAVDDQTCAGAILEAIEARIAAGSE